MENQDLKKNLGLLKTSNGGPPQVSYEKRVPSIEVREFLSKDGKYFVTKIIQTVIRPAGYIKKIMGEEDLPPVHL